MKSMCCWCIQFTNENTSERTILHLVKKTTLSKVWLLALQKRLATPLTCMYYDLRDNKEEDNNANRDFI